MKTRIHCLITVIALSTAAALHPAAAQVPLADLALWLKADAGVTQDANGLVSVWEDQSGAGMHLGQANATLQPLWVAEVANGQPALTFSGDVLVRPAVAGSSLLANQAVTVFVVQRQNGSAGRTTTLSWVAPGDQRLLVHATWEDVLSLQVGNPNAGGVINVGQPAGWDNRWHLLALRRQGSEGEMRIDRATHFSRAAFASEADSALTADLQVGADVFGNQFAGEIAEILIYRTALSDADRASVEDYLAGKYGLVSAPADLLVRRQDDPGFIGNNLYNAEGAGQTLATGIEAAETAVYRVQLQNDGAARGIFQVTGTGSSEGWDVRYYAPQSGLRFDGADDHVELGNWTPGPHWTVELWAQATYTPTGRRTIAGGFADCADWGLTMQEGQFGVALKPPGGCTQTLVTGEPVVPGAWYHLAGTCDGATAQLFVNGQLKASAPVQPEYGGTAASARIGGEVCCNGNNFPGKVREVRIWKRALTPDEVAAAMTRAPLVDDPDLMGYWPLNERGGAWAFDASAQGRHGRLANGPAWETSAIDVRQACDVTAEITGLGWTGLLLPAGGRVELLLEVRPGSGVAAGQTKEVQVAARPLAGGEAPDVVKTITAVAGAGTAAVGGSYTSTADFQAGRGVGVEYHTVPNQIQLARAAAALPVIWVPNSNEGTVSKVDTWTGRELGRYRTGPRSDASPSRTTVDLQGNCWVANRVTGTAVKFGLLENGQYVDRNGNGLIETSRDVNGDGDITGDELLPWGQDECVLFEIALVPGQEGTFVPGSAGVPYASDNWNPGTRGIAVDAQGNVWLGTYGTRKFYFVSGSSGQILKTVDVSAVNHTSYGAVIDEHGILWSAGQDKAHLLRLDPLTAAITTVPVGHFVYGINVDGRGHLFVSGWQDSRLTRVNTRTAEKDWTQVGLYEARGVAVTPDGDVWTANSGPGTVARWSNDGLLKATIPVGATPTGVAVDAEGKVWAVNTGDEYIKRIDPATESVDLSKRIIGATHYGYSDMTGIIARNTTTRVGAWSVVHNSTLPQTPWGVVSWSSQEPAGTAVRVRVRSSNDRRQWSLWETAFNNVQLVATPPGKYLELEVSLQSDSGDVSPVVYDLRVQPADSAHLGSEVYRQDFAGEAGAEWSVATTDMTPVGTRQFLGQFGNQTVSLALSHLPPHVAVTIEYDLYVIRAWEGNSTAGDTGPDQWELNVGGGLRLLHTTFSNLGDNPQAFPGSVPEGSNPAGTGASEVNTLGYAGSGPMDTVYHMQHTLPHSANFLVLNFAASGLSSNLSEQSWGLDNVRVFVTPESVPIRLLSVAVTSGGVLQLELAGNSQQRYVLEGSADLREWLGLNTNTLIGDRMTLVDDQAAQHPQRFYRLRQLP